MVIQPIRRCPPVYTDNPQHSCNGVFRNRRCANAAMVSALPSRTMTLKRTKWWLPFLVINSVLVKFYKYFRRKVWGIILLRRFLYLTRVLQNKKKKSLTSTTDIHVIFHQQHWILPRQSLRIQDNILNLLRGETRNNDRGYAHLLTIWGATVSPALKQPQESKNISCSVRHSMPSDRSDRFL